MIHIVIAEDHSVVADGLATMLSFEEDMEVVDIVTSGEALVESVDRQRPEVALVDVSLNGMDGVTAVREIQARGIPTRAMALTMFADHDTVTRAVAAGVAGYLPKNVRRGELVQAVRAVAAGKGFLHPDVTRPFLERAGSVATPADLTPLSAREQEVLEQLATGRSTREIAQALSLGDETVKSHLVSHLRQAQGQRPGRGRRDGDAPGAGELTARPAVQPGANEAGSCLSATMGMAGIPPSGTACIPRQGRPYPPYRDFYSSPGIAASGASGADRVEGNRPDE